MTNLKWFSVHYNNLLFIKAARRTVNSLPQECADMLSIRVALERISTKLQLSAPDKHIVSQMVLAHQQNWIPLPKIRAQYPLKRWQGLCFCALNMPASQLLIQDATRRLTTLAQEIGRDKLEMVIGTSVHTFAQSLVMRHLPRYVFSLTGVPDRWPYTPASLCEMMGLVLTGIQTVSLPLLNTLCDVTIYKYNQDLQAIIDRFRPLDHGICENLMRWVHHIRFAHKGEKTGRILPAALWDSSSIMDVIQADACANASHTAYGQVFDTKRLARINELKQIIELVGVHPGNVTRMLKRKHSPICLKTAKSQYSATCEIDLNDGGLLITQHRRLRDILRYVEITDLNLFRLYT